MDPAKLEMVKLAYREWGSGNYDRGDFLHADFELVFARGLVDEGVYSGWAAAWQGWKGWMEQWASWDYEPVEFLDAGDGRILVYVDIHGVAKSTGMPIEHKTANLWEFEDGLVRRVTLYAHREDFSRDPAP